MSEKKKGMRKNTIEFFLIPLNCVTVKIPPPAMQGEGSSLDISNLLC